MSEIYWITVMGHIRIASIIMVVASVISLLALAVAIADNAGDDEDLDKKMKQHFKRILIALAFGTAVLVFVPSTKEMLAIYGIGGTMDYIKGNEKARQLPDKVVDALDKWFDDENGEEKK